MKDARAQFGKTAAAYVTSTTHASGADLERLIAVAAPLPGERALDVGCGVGHTLRRIAPLVLFAVGADATFEMMQAGRDSVVTDANVAFVQSDATALPFADASFDLATCRLAAHHFTDVAAAFRDVRRVLRPGGRFVLVDNYAPDDAALDTFINEVEKLRDASHVRNHTIAGWRESLEISAGRVRRAGHVCRCGLAELCARVLHRFFSNSTVVARVYPFAFQNSIAAVLSSQTMRFTFGQPRSRNRSSMVRTNRAPSPRRR